MSDRDFPSGSPPPADKEEAGAVRRVRTKILGRIALEHTASHTTVRHGPEGWRPFLPGVRCKVLREEEGSLSYLLQLDPGAELRAHRHPRDEECLVLQGDLHISDVLVLGAGDYHFARAGRYHAAIGSKHGALLFLRGAAPQADDFL